jgi:hypothetical protein
MLLRRGKKQPQNIKSGGGNMKNFNFSVSGNQRKKLAAAMSEILNQPVTYLGVPTFVYEIGGYNIDKKGVVTGKYEASLFAGLKERGFKPEEAEELTAPAPEAAISEKADAIASDETTNAALINDTNLLTVEYPLEGFTPEAIDNLSKMVQAKEPLLKKALGADALPIRVTPESLQFPWFRLENPEDAAYFTQFICALCQTAKSKKRVIAKAPTGDFENEKFAMRVWGTGLGLIGKEYSQIRKLLSKNLCGNSGWRYGNPKNNAKKDSKTSDFQAPNADEMPTGDVAADE